MPITPAGAVERVEMTLFEDGQRVASERVDLIGLAREGLPDYVSGHHLPVSVPPDSRCTVVLKLETPIAHPGLLFIKPFEEAAAEAYYHLIAVLDGYRRHGGAHPL